MEFQVVAEKVLRNTIKGFPTIKQVERHKEYVKSIEVLPWEKVAYLPLHHRGKGWKGVEMKRKGREGKGLSCLDYRTRYLFYRQTGDVKVYRVRVHIYNVFVALQHFTVFSLQVSPFHKPLNNTRGVH